MKVVRRVSSVFAVAIVSISSASALAVDESPMNVVVSVDAAKVHREMDPRRLGSTNVAMWYFPATYSAPDVKTLVADLHPRYIRIPGGSWANGVYWNGNGVRRADGSVDPSKVGPDGYPAVDYSDYAPSFLVDTKTLHPASNGWHGHTDVKTQHDWIKSFPGVEAMACPNAGTGRAVDAAEWVKWANKKMDYNVRVWEIGNELGGSWEAGTDMPLGKGPLTAEIYTARYNEMAKAMRAKDPTIKIGSCPFVEEALRDCGDNVDFVSIHTYPGSTTLTESQMLADISRTVAREMDPVKAWIHKYQPTREKQIEIAYSEWNLAGGMDNGRLFSSLWSSIFLGEIARNGANMANQWDLFNDLLLSVDDGKKYVAKAEYYAIWLWNNYMGDRLIAANSNDPLIYTCATRSDDAVMVMLVNTDRDREAHVNLKISGFTPGEAGEVARVSTLEYFYSAMNKRMFWSRGAGIEALKTGSDFGLDVAPYSIAYVRVPAQSRPGLSAMALRAQAEKKMQAAEHPELQFLIPAEVYAGDLVDGELVAMSVEASGSRPVALPPATLTASGEAGLDRHSVRLAEAVGRFSIKPTAPGELTLMAQSGDIKASQKILVKPSTPRPIMFWDFTKPLVTDQETFSSRYVLREDLNQRANRAVARVDLPAQGAPPNAPDGDRVLLGVQQFPEASRLIRANIRGVIVDIKTSPDFACDDPDARIMVVIQSPANWWMPIGTIPLKSAAEWKSHQVDVKSEEFIKALPSAGSLFFVLRSSKPVKGSIYFDHIGFMVR